MPLTTTSLREIADLVTTGRMVYRALATFAFVFSCGAGFFYLRSLNLGGVPLSHVWLAWMILCLSQAIGVLANVWNCLLLGVGYVGWDSVLGSLASALTLLAQILAASCGGGLISLAVVAAGGALFQRLLLFGFARARRPELFSIRGAWKGAALRQMVPLAIKAWLTSTGLVLVLNTDQLFIGKMIGPAQIPAYRAAYLILLNLNMLAVTVASASTVFVSHLWQADQIKSVHVLVTRNLRLGLGLMASGSACILVLGQRLFHLWLGPGNFIGYPILIIFAALLFLEAQCFIVTSGSRATEDEAFAPWAIGAGLLKLLLSFLLGLRYGLLGIAASTLIAELCTNHWYMVYRGLRRLRMGLREYVRSVVLPIAALFCVTAGAVWGTLFLERTNNNLTQVFSGCSVASVILSASLWILVLDQSQRQRWLSYVRLRS